MGAAAKSALKKIAEKNYKETLEKRNLQKKQEADELEKLRKKKEENNAVK